MNQSLFPGRTNMNDKKHDWLAKLIQRRKKIVMSVQLEKKKKIKISDIAKIERPYETLSKIYVSKHQRV